MVVVMVVDCLRPERTAVVCLDVVVVGDDDDDVDSWFYLLSVLACSLTHSPLKRRGGRGGDGGRFVGALLSKYRHYTYEAADILCMMLLRCSASDKSGYAGSRRRHRRCRSSLSSSSVFTTT